MSTENEIKTKYKALHNSLTEDYYKNHLMSKEDFDYYHGQNWEDMKAELIIEGYRKPVEPVKDLIAEINDLKAKVEKLEMKYLGYS